MYLVHRRYERTSEYEQAVAASSSMICSGWPQLISHLERCRLGSHGDKDRVAGAVCALDKAATDINVLIKPPAAAGRG